tara:strand:- start:5278 stop:5448 length:171 start_codon:yes stop_codon:yes gene_type:complete
VKNKKINQVLKSKNFANYGGTYCAKNAFYTTAFDGGIIKVVHENYSCGEYCLESIC